MGLFFRDKDKMNTNIYQPKPRWQGLNPSLRILQIFLSAVGRKYNDIFIVLTPTISECQYKKFVNYARKYARDSINLNSLMIVEVN